MRFIDLAVPTDPAIHDISKTKYTRIYHEEGAKQAASFFGLKQSDFVGGILWANGAVELNEHSGTHMDAPIHYAETSEGKPAPAIDEVPLEWCYGDGVVLDFHTKGAGYAITRQDIIDELKRIHYEIKPGDIVLIRSDADKKLYAPDYMSSHAGMTAEATTYLIEQGVRVMGTDGWGWDIPLPLAVEKYKQSNGSYTIWEGHLVGRQYEYYHIEKLANLDQLPPYGFKVMAFPVKLKGGTAAWVRPVALLQE